MELSFAAGPCICRLPVDGAVHIADFFYLCVTSWPSDICLPADLSKRWNESDLCGCLLQRSIKTASSCSSPVHCCTCSSPVDCGTWYRDAHSALRKWHHTAGRCVSSCLTSAAVSVRPISSDATTSSASRESTQPSLCSNTWWSSPTWPSTWRPSGTSAAKRWWWPLLLKTNATKTQHKDSSWRQTILKVTEKNHWRSQSMTLPKTLKGPIQRFQRQTDSLCCFNLDYVEVKAK